MKTNIRDISIYFYAYPISFHSYVHLRLLVGEDRPCIRSNGCIVVVDAFFLSFLANCKYAAWHLVVNLTVEADRGQVDNVAAASSQRQGLAAGSDLDRISSCWPAQRTRRLRAERGVKQRTAHEMTFPTDGGLWEAYRGSPDSQGRTHGRWATTPNEEKLTTMGLLCPQ